MKKHRFFSLLGIFLILGLGLWWQLSFRNEADSQQAKRPVLVIPDKEQKSPPVVLTPVPLPYQVTGGSDDEGTPETTNSPVRSAAKAQLLSTHPLARRTQVAAVLSQLNDKDIDFYGKVVDQNGNVIPDVKVTGSAIYNSDRGSGVQEKHTTTDAKGYFEFHGLKGRSFDYHLEKTGYETMPDPDVSFDFTELVPANKRFHPDPKNPVVLKMWKLHGAEPMIKGSKHLEVIPDGKPIHFDLQTAKVVEDGGDIILSLQHDHLPRGIAVSGWPWKGEIAAVDGGFFASKLRLTGMYSAPESGYVPFQPTAHQPISIS